MAWEKAVQELGKIIITTTITRVERVQKSAILGMTKIIRRSLIPKEASCDPVSKEKFQTFVRTNHHHNNDIIMIIIIIIIMMMIITTIILIKANNNNNNGKIMAQKKYQRHSLVGKKMHWEICRSFGMKVSKKWYQQEPETVVEN